MHTAAPPIVQTTTTMKRVRPMTNNSHQTSQRNRLLCVSKFGIKPLKSLKTILEALLNRIDIPIKRCTKDFNAQQFMFHFHTDVYEFLIVSLTFSNI